MVTEIPEGIHRSIKEKLLKKKLKIAEMVHENSADLSEKRIIYRRSLVGSKEKGKKTHKITAFVVKGYESVILIQLGKTIGLIPEGIYEIEKNFQYTGTEIIWIDKTEFKTKWGLSDIYLKDNIKIGAYGSLIVKISGPKNFVMNVVSDKNIVERKQVDDFIFSLVVQTYKDVFVDFSINDVLQSRDIIKQKVQAKLYDILNHWGIELINLEVEGFKLPEKFDELGDLSLEEIVREKRKTQEIGRMKDQIDVLQVKQELDTQKRGVISSDKSFERQQKVLDAEMGYEKAKYDAGAQQIHGNVDIDLLEKQQVAKVAGGVKIIKTISENDVKLAELETVKEIGVAQAGAENEEAKEEKKEKERKKIKIEIDNLKDKLDKLDNMLDNDKISEETYKLRVERIERDLRHLESEFEYYE